MPRSLFFMVTYLAFISPAWADEAGKPLPSRLVTIENKGMLIRECTLPGETRADDVTSGQVAAVQASRNLWLLVYATRGWRGVDDERSIVYQLRRERPDGPLLKEGFLARSHHEWDPLGNGVKCVKQHGHPVVCGVPKGALIEGKPAAHANLFVVKWRLVGVPYDSDRKAVLRDKDGLLAKTQAVEWLQLRLKDDESDLEVVQPVQLMRQKGHEKGEAICSAKIAWMNQSFVPPVPFNKACTEWADVNHFDGGRIAALKLAFNPVTKRYEWTETGPLVGDVEQGLSEASLAHVGNRWVVAARVSSKKRNGVAWAQTDDPFAYVPTPVIENEPVTDAPLTAFTCADGVLRVFTGDGKASPRYRTRDPLFGWEVAVGKDGFTVGNRRLIFDSVHEGVQFRHEVWPRVDFALLFPPHEKTQLLAYRVSTRAYNFPYNGRKDIPPINAAEKPFCGIYYTKLTFEDVQSAPWTFPPQPGK